MQQEHQADDLITVAEAAQRTGRSLQTIYNWVRKGEVEDYKIKGKHYVSIPEIEARHKAGVFSVTYEEREAHQLRHHQISLINCSAILQEYDRKNRKYYDFDRYPVA